MKKYVLVPAYLLHDSEGLTSWLKKILNYVRSMPPKVER
jgi:hypothetical protein